MHWILIWLRTWLLESEQKQSVIIACIWQPAFCFLGKSAVTVLKACWEFRVVVVTRRHQVWHFHSNQSSAVLSKALNTFKYLLGKKRKKNKSKTITTTTTTKTTTLPHAFDSSIEVTTMFSFGWRKGRKIKFTQISYALAKLISFEEVKRTSINSLWSNKTNASIKT